MKKCKLTCAAPDGRTLSRVTAREYSHVVLVQIENVWQDPHWCRSFPLAQKAARGWVGRGAPVKIVPVNP